MAKEIQILQESQSEVIRNYELIKLQQSLKDTMEIEMTSWNAPWREESLKLYLNTGWSVGLWDGSKLIGYFLAQPLLFYKGLTQVLWVEHMSFDSEDDQKILIDTATKYSREKHLQSVFIFSTAGILEVKTTKR